MISTSLKRRQHNFLLILIPSIIIPLRIREDFFYNDILSFLCSIYCIVNSPSNVGSFQIKSNLSEMNCDDSAGKTLFLILPYLLLVDFFLPAFKNLTSSYALFDDAKTTRFFFPPPITNTDIIGELSLIIKF